ncbi:hypothetical protein Tco_0798150 [Tanacetum coccineum]
MADTELLAHLLQAYHRGVLRTQSLFLEIVANNFELRHGIIQSCPEQTVLRFIEAAAGRKLFGQMPFANDIVEHALRQEEPKLLLLLRPAPVKQTRASTYDSWLHQFRTHANPSSSTPYVPPTKKDWDILFQPMFDEYFQPSLSVVSRVPPTISPFHTNTTGTPSSTSIDQDAPSASTSPTT